MKKIKFEKYSLYGNDFVIIDETQQELLTEEQKSSFAKISFDDIFGMSADNLLVIQKNTHENLNQIKAYRNYWTTLDADSVKDVDFIFRMFEPDGSEALCCGNGLLSIAYYLEDEYGIEHSTILTEIPIGKPVIRKLISELTDDYSALNIGVPRAVPDSFLIGPSFSRKNELQEILNFKLSSNPLLKIFGYDQPDIELNGYLKFTGEPHLVVFSHENNDDLFNILIGDDYNLNDRVQGILNFDLSNQILNLLGLELNNMKSVFPKGINLNVARVLNHNIIEYRTFERGIDRETYACGTGATAVAFVASHLRLVDGEEIFLFPKRPRTFTGNNMELKVLPNQENGDWILKGKPQKIFTGYRNLDF